MALNQGNRLPLEGIRVIDWTTHVATPRAGRMLADLGADVIKIEALKGDEWRIVGDAYDIPTEDDENPFFTGENSNKKLISLNMKSDQGKEIFFKLLDTADVFLSNVRFKSLQKMGVFYDDIKDRYPRLVYCHFSGFGYEGPDAERPGFDSAAFWARTGPIGDWVPEGTFPIKPTPAFGDTVTSSLVFGGILTALFARERTGMGTLVTTSLFSSGIWANLCGVLQTQEPFQYQYPEDPTRPNNPFCHNYQCKDGKWISVVIIDYDKNWDKNCDLFGLEAYHDDPRFNSLDNLKQADHKFELYNILREAMLTRTREEWVQRFIAFDVVYELIAKLKDVATDEQAWANGYLEKVRFPSGGSAVLPTTPLQFSNYTVKKIKPTGAIGRDTDQVLGELGYTPAEIAAMRNREEIL